MHKIIVSIVVGMLIFHSAWAAEKSTIPPDWQIIDQGDSESPSAWKYDRGVWTQASNIYGGEQDPSELKKPGTFMIAGDSELTDGVIGVEIRSDDNDAIGIMFRYVDEDNYYRFSMDKQRKYRRLVKVVDGVVTPLAEDHFAYETGKWYALEIATAGARIKVAIDGQMIFDVEDTEHENGRLALYCWGNATSKFRKIEVKPQKEPVSQETSIRGTNDTAKLNPTVKTSSIESDVKSQEMSSPEPNSVETKMAELTEPGYVIGPGDVLDLSVWRDDALTGQFVVLPDGRISFPLIGEVHAAGKTVSQLKTEMAERLKAFIPKPEMHIAIRSVGSMVIYLIGKVHGPGRYTMNQNLDVMQALAMAGGLNPFAKKREIRIFRQEGEQTEIFYFNYNEVAEGKHLEQNIELKRGDVIVVP